MESDRLPDRLALGTEEVRVHVQTPDLLVLEVRLPPGGGPPVLHRHAPEEVYRVLEGELALHLEEAPGTVRRRVVRAGDVAHIPAGREHTVRNESGEGAVALAVFAPGAPMIGFLRAASRLEAPAPADVLALADRHGIAMTRPV
jgi:mannose-6-phosphate isomerase-like protein (cupin superfamily)